jgi:hypothetical protein
MNDTTASARDAQLLSKEEMEGDRRLELILDECVMSSPAPAWGAELTARVMAARPFAPWEVRRARAWRAPALAAGGLLAASVVVFLAPLWSLGPQTALETWARVMAAGTTAGLPALLAAIPALAEALGKVLSGTPGARPALAGALLASGAAFATFATIAQRWSRHPSRLARALVGSPRG